MNEAAEARKLPATNHWRKLRRLLLLRPASRAAGHGCWPGPGCIIDSHLSRTEIVGAYSRENDTKAARKVNVTLLTNKCDRILRRGDVLWGLMKEAVGAPRATHRFSLSSRTA